MTRSVSKRDSNKPSPHCDPEGAPVIRLPLHLRPRRSESGEPPDKCFIEALGRGEPEAIARVYDVHHEALRAFCQRFLGDQVSAEDLVHDTFISLPRAARRFRGDASLRSFLIGIAINHCRHHLRRAIRQRRAVKSLSQMQRVVPSSTGLHAEQAMALSRALDTLSLKHRSVFVLCEVEQRSLHEVSQIIKVAEGTIKSRLHHARKELRRFLGEVPR